MFQQVTGRDIAALMNPRPLMVLSAQHEEDASMATVVWTMPVSHEPAMIALSIRESSQTLRLLRKAGVFGLSILDGRDEDSERTAITCGTTTGAAVDKLSAVPHMVKSYVHEGKLQTFIFPHTALSYLACAVKKIEPAGDHLLVIGDVVGAHTKSDRDTEGRISATNSLLCVQSDDFRSL